MFIIELYIINNTSSFHIGFLPPPGLCFVMYSCVPIRNLAYGSALPNIPSPAFNSIPLKHFTTSRPNLGGGGADGGAIASLNMYYKK